MDVVQIRRRAPYYHEGDQRPEAPTPTHLRASRNQQPRRTEEDEQLIDSLAGQRQPRQRGHTEKLRSGQERQQPRRQRSPLLFIGLGMCLALVVWSILLHIGVWYMNTLHNPAQYTQTAHLDAVTVTDAQGHRSQARAFIDAQNHIDIVVIPEDQPDKARIIVGPVITQVVNPQHAATITATAHSTLVTVIVAGPLFANWLTTSQESQGWTIDVSQQPKGGK